LTGPGKKKDAGKRFRERFAELTVEGFGLTAFADIINA
jgi:hypothetical protein